MTSLRDQLSHPLVDALVDAGVDRSAAVDVVDDRQFAFGVRDAADRITADIRLLQLGLPTETLADWARAGVDTLDFLDGPDVVFDLTVEDLVVAVEDDVSSQLLGLAHRLGLSYEQARAGWAVLGHNFAWHHTLLTWIRDGVLSDADVEFCRRFRLASCGLRDLPGRKPQHDLAELSVGPARQVYLVVLLRDGDQDEAWRVAQLLVGQPWADMAVQFILDHEQSYDEAIATAENLERLANQAPALRTAAPVASDAVTRPVRSTYRAPRADPASRERDVPGMA